VTSPGMSEPRIGRPLSALGPSKEPQNLLTDISGKVADPDRRIAL
jgi:hypothetical protein